MLSLLDLSAAVDTVDHHLLLQRLRTSYTVSMALSLSGSRLTWPAARSSSVQVLPPRCHCQSCTGFHRIGHWSDPFSAVRRPSPAVDKTPPASSSRVRRRHADLRLLSTMWRRRPLRQNVCRLCRRECCRGWGPTVWWQIRQKPRSCGARRAVVRTRYQPHQYGSAPLMCRGVLITDSVTSRKMRPKKLRPKNVNDQKNSVINRSDQFLAQW